MSGYYDLRTVTGFVAIVSKSLKESVAITVEGFHTDYAVILN